MKNARRILSGLALGCCCWAAALPLSSLGQGTAFTYQGRLNDNGTPATGRYDLRFILYDADPGGSQQGPVLTNSAVAVTGGLFTVTLDFGQSFPGTDRWVELAVRTNGGAAFATLSPRQKITAAPYAITAGSATSLSGAYSGAVTFNNPSNQFSGNGSGLTNINAATLNGLGPAAFWKTAGNSGTTAGPSFVGTSDNQPLELKVDNQRALRLEPNTNGAPNLIAGASVNVVASGILGSTIAGGGAAQIFGNSYSNSVSGNFSTIGGGLANNIATNSDSAVIAGGNFNNIDIDSAQSAIGGGIQNVIGPDSSAATIGGGQNNLIDSAAGESTIGGGYRNEIRPAAQYAVIGGGYQNTNSASQSTIGGGYHHTIQTNCEAATIGGGFFNQIRQGSISSTIAGGENLIIFNGSDHATIGGGFFNRIEAGSSSSGISAGQQNDVMAKYAIISGGSNNAVAAGADFACVGGGDSNNGAGKYSTVPGGQLNKAAGDFSFAAGRRAKAIHGGSFVWGDSASPAGTDFSSTGTNQFLIRAGGGVGIGTASPSGQLDVAGSTIIRGLSTPSSSATNLLNLGVGVSSDGLRNGISFFEGGGASGPAMMFGYDGVGSSSANALRIYSSGNVPLFTFQANGGLGISTTNPLTALHVRDSVDAEISIESTDAGSHRWTLQSSRVNGNVSTDGSFQIIDRGTGGGSRLLIGTNGNVGIGTNSPGQKLHVVGNIIASGSICANNGVSCASDRNVKENFQPINSRGVLEKVAQLPLTQWNYKTDPGTPHLGPVAQDFRAAFGLGTDDRSICMIDEGGVALAAIQGLNQKLEHELDSIRKELHRREAENAALKQSVRELKNLMEQMNETLAHPSVP
jgi:trimeric autotransporter adhesin